MQEPASLSLCFFKILQIEDSLEAGNRLGSFSLEVEHRPQPQRRERALPVGRPPVRKRVSLLSGCILPVAL